MQTTLLGLAIALILALLAALVGPYFINWDNHRALLETEASRLVGLSVRVSGPIKVSVLPTPAMTLNDIEIGPAGQASRLRARSLSIELGLGSLVRGEIRAVETRLVGPQFGIGLNSLGRIDWPAMTPHSDTVAIERLNIEDGRVVLTDAVSNSRVVLDKLWFRGQVRSLTGPFRGEGAFVSGSEIHGYKVSAGRLTDDGVRVKLNIEIAERPLVLEIDGTMAADRNAPRFEGSLAMSRPAGSVKASGKAIAYEPWKLTGKVKANAQSALLEQIEFQYGPEERAAKLDGAAEIKFGERPRLQGALSARQIDLDRLIATTAAPRRLPVAATQAFAELFGGMIRPSIPVLLTVSIDAVTLGGAVLQSFGGDLRSDGKVWRIDKLDFRAPGFTKASISGRLVPAGKGLGFDGSASVDVGDPKALVAWLGGQPVAAGQMLVKPWQLRGDITLGPDRIAIEQFRAEFDRGAVDGRLAYLWPTAGQPAKLDAALKAAELDLDALLGFADGAFDGIGIEPPREIALALEAGRARIAGFEARNSTARLKFDSSAIQIERLSIADFGNATIEASGRIETTATPGGTITLDLDARELDAVIALAEKFAPMLVEPLRRMSGRDRTAKLRATASLEQAIGGSAAGKIALAGRIGAVRLELTAAASGAPDNFAITKLGALAPTQAQIDGMFESSDATQLLGVIGFDRIAEMERFVAGGNPARLTVTTTGPLNRELRLQGRLAVGTFDMSGKGALRLPDGQPASLTLEQVSGVIAGHKVRGRLALRFGDAPQIDGSIETDLLDAPLLVAAAIGMRAKSGSGWATDPFTPSVSELGGRIEVTAARATLSSAWQARQVRGVVRFSPSEVVFEGFDGELANGRFGGRVAFVTGPDGVTVRARAELSGADAAALIGGSTPRAPVAGRLAFRAELEGSGRSPAAFIGSLAGRGSIVLENAQLAGLNPRVFDAVMRAVDLGIPTDINRIRDFVSTALDHGTLPSQRAEGKIAIAAGQARLNDVVTRATGADLSVSANVDLSDATLDAVLTLSGTAALGGGARPSITVGLRGPIGSPTRSIDANALASWLSLRAIERQSKEIEEMEAKRREKEQQDETAREAAQPSALSPGEAPAVLSDGGHDTEAVVPPLPPAINVLPAPKPRAAPRVEAPQPKPPAAPKPAAPKPAVAPANPPLDLIGAQR